MRGIRGPLSKSGVVAGLRRATAPLGSLALARDDVPGHRASSLWFSARCATAYKKLTRIEVIPKRSEGSPAVFGSPICAASWPGCWCHPPLWDPSLTLGMTAIVPGHDRFTGRSHCSPAQDDSWAGRSPSGKIPPRSARSGMTRLAGWFPGPPAPL